MSRGKIVNIILVHNHYLVSLDAELLCVTSKITVARSKVK
jgi:hypothetical protein